MDNILEYALIVSGIIIIVLTILPPTWNIDVGTFILGALFVVQGLRMLKDKIDSPENFK